MGMGSRAWWTSMVVTSVAVATSALPTTAAGQLCAEPQRATTPPRVIDATLPAEAADALEPALRELLEGLDVWLCTVRRDRVDGEEALVPPARPRAALGRVWVAVADGELAVYVVDGAWARVLVRRVPLEEGIDEVAREQVGHIVHAATEALIAGAPIGVLREDLESIRPDERDVEEPVDPPARSGADVMPELSWAYRAHGGVIEPAHELGGGLSVALGTGSVWPRFSLRIAGRLPTVSPTDRIDLTLSGIRLHADAGARVNLNESTHLFFSLGLGVEVTVIDADAVAGSTVVPNPPQTEVLPLLTGRAGIAQRLEAPVWLAGGFDVDWDVSDAHYVIDDGLVQPTVADPWVLRPAVWAALAVAVEP